MTLANPRALDTPAAPPLALAPPPTAPAPTPAAPAHAPAPVTRAPAPVARAPTHAPAPPIMPVFGLGPTTSIAHASPASTIPSLNSLQPMSTPITPITPPPPFPRAYRFRIETPAAMRRRFGGTPTHDTQQHRQRANAILFTPNRSRANRAAQQFSQDSPTPAGHAGDLSALPITSDAELEETIQRLNLEDAPRGRTKRKGRSRQKVSDVWTFTRTESGDRYCVFCEYVILILILITD